MKIRYRGPRRGTFQMTGQATRKSYSFNAGFLREQEVDDRDARLLLERLDFEAASNPAPAPSPPVFVPKPVLSASAFEPVPPSARLKPEPKAPTAEDLKRLEGQLASEPEDRPKDDFVALLGVKPEVSEAMHAAGLAELSSVKAASDDELRSIKGVGPTILKRIRRKLNA